MKSRLAALLAASLVFPPGVFAAPSTGLVKGQVSLDGRALAGLEVTLVDVATGAVHTVRTAPDGTFEARLAPGSYVIASRSRGGLSVGRGPTLVSVESGKVASASVEMVALTAALQDPAPAAGANVGHEAIGCLVANEFPYFEAKIEPAASVVRARVYFKSVLSDEWYYVEMTQADGVFTGVLPRPTMAASPITYYIQATTTDFGESRTPEISAEVVEKPEDCPDDKKVAPVGPPPAGGVTLFSASTGAAAGLPAGFAAGGALLGTGALIGLGGALLGGGVIAATGGTTTTTTTTTTSTTTTTTVAPPPPPVVNVAAECKVAPTATGPDSSPTFPIIANCTRAVSPNALTSAGQFGDIVVTTSSNGTVSEDPSLPGQEAWTPILCSCRIDSVGFRQLSTIGLRVGQRGTVDTTANSCSFGFQAPNPLVTDNVFVPIEVVMGWKISGALKALCDADPFCSVNENTCPVLP